MTAMENSARALERCCRGDREAMEFLLLWRAYVHAIDDIIDQDTSDMDAERRNEFILATFASAIRLYSHAFYLKNIAALRAVAFSITNAYADSVAFEKSEGRDPKAESNWQKEWADHHRHAGAEMVLAVAQICGGYEHVRTLSPELRCVGWQEGSIRRDGRDAGRSEGRNPKAESNGKEQMANGKPE